jgi:transcriptional regulator with XRE-family HTH domain
MPNDGCIGVVSVVNLGARIRKCRGTRGWSISKLARAAGVSQGYLSDVENGKIASPSGTAIGKLAEALNVSSDHLLGLTDDPSPTPSYDESEVIIRNYPEPPEGYEELSPEQREDLDRATRNFQRQIIEMLLKERGQSRR